jgi:hypothetical protein
MVRYLLIGQRPERCPYRFGHLATKGSNREESSDGIETNVGPRHGERRVHSARQRGPADGGLFADRIGIVFVTHFLDRVYALGGNRTAAALMGVPIGSMTMRIYMLSSVLAGIAGIVFSFYTAAGYSLSAVGVELDTIAAVVIGGTLLTGGQGSTVGTFIGVLIQGLIQSYINVDGTLSSWWTKIATGILLFLFIGLQQGILKLATRSRARQAGVAKP